MNFFQHTDDLLFRIEKDGASYRLKDGKPWQAASSYFGYLRIDVGFYFNKHPSYGRAL